MFVARVPAGGLEDFGIVLLWTDEELGERSLSLKLLNFSGKTNGANAMHRMRYASPMIDQATIGLPGGPGYLDHPKMIKRPQTRKLTTDKVTENNTGDKSSRALDLPLRQSSASEAIVLQKCRQTSIFE